MGIKSFFQNIGRGIKRGFNNFVQKAGNFIGGAGTFIQRKAIPAIASGANSVAGLIGKAAPLLDAAGPEAAAAGAEVADVASQVGSGVGKFAKFIGSDLPTKGRMATPDEINKFRASIPQGKTFFGIKPLPPPPMPTAPSAPLVPPAKPSTFVMPPMAKGLISPAPAPNPLKLAGMAIKPLIGSNPNTYTPKMSSGIEASSSDQPSVKMMGGGSGAPMLSM
jgi:hypothetical protein